MASRLEDSDDKLPRANQSPLISWPVWLLTPIVSFFESLLFTTGLHPGFIWTRVGMVIGNLSSWLGYGSSYSSTAPPVKARRSGRRLRELSSEDEDSLSSQDDPMGCSTAREPVVALRRRHAAQVDRQDEYATSLYPGMVNLSGTLCYMNSALQSFASLTCLQRHLESIIKLAEEVDLNTPVTDALSLVLEELNTPSSSSRPPPLRPYALVDALSTLPAVRRLLQTRDHQDAHELFLLISNAINEELKKLLKERRRNVGLPEILDLAADLRTGKTSVVHSARASPGPGYDEDFAAKTAHRRSKGKQAEVLSPWEGLSANRRSCLKCGYCEAIRYEVMGALDVAVPMSGQARLEDCLKQLTAIEVIDGAHCDACTLRLTTAWYQSEAQRLAQPTGDPPVPPSTARRKRAREARRIRDKLEELLEKGAVSGMESQPGLEECKWLRGRSKSAKQTMIARPPPILCLHLVRSEYTPYGQIVKKTPHIFFPSLLEITSFVTSGELHMTADGPISRHAPSDWPSDQPPPKDGPNPLRQLYRLDAVICHYGFTHSFGHFVAYRRKPDTALGPRILSKSCPDGCQCEDCMYMGQVRDPHAPVTLRNWLRISDADVEEVSESDVLAERSSAVLLFYERIKEYEGGQTGAATVATPSTMDAVMSQLRKREEASMQRGDSKL